MSDTTKICPDCNKNTIPESAYVSHVCCEDCAEANGPDIMEQRIERASSSAIQSYLKYKVYLE